MSRKQQQQQQQQGQQNQQGQAVEQSIVTQDVNTSLENIPELLQQALTIDKNSLYQTIDIGEGKTTQILQKTYDFTTAKGDRTQVTIYDADIISSTEKIEKAMQGRKILAFVVCKELAKLSQSNKLEKLGFKNVSEYANHLFGIQTSTANHYAKIGKYFINDNYTVKAGLPNLSVSHFVELNTLVPDDGDLTEIIKLFANGTLTDGMSTKDFRKAVKEIMNNALPDNIIEEQVIESNKVATLEESETQATETKQTEKVENSSKVENVTKDFDLQVVIGQILSSCNDIEEYFKVIAKNGIQVVGYEENIDMIKYMAKNLLQ